MIRYVSFSPVISLACLLLVSCATVKQQITTEPAAWAAEQQKRQQIKNWEIRGRLGVQTETNGGSMDIIWKNADQDYSIRLIAPLAAGNYLVQGNNDYAEIRYPDGKIDIVSDIDVVFSSILDVNLPASAVRDWIRGLPSKALPVERISWNEQSLPGKIEQSGWNVELSRYTGKEILMPHVIYLNRDGNDELDVRLVLRQWLIDN